MITGCYRVTFSSIELTVVAVTIRIIRDEMALITCTATARARIQNWTPEQTSSRFMPAYNHPTDTGTELQKVSKFYVWFLFISKGMI